MTDTVTPARAHTYSSRTAVMPDGMIGTWYSVDGKELWSGFFFMQLIADYELTNLTNSARARFGDAPVGLAELDISHEGDQPTLESLELTVTPLAAHTVTGRTATMPDGLIGGWVSVDGRETWSGTFSDMNRAKFSLNRQIASLNTGYGNPPDQGALP